jgi:transcriptional regulator with XRE-family HTH domain
MQNREDKQCLRPPPYDLAMHIGLTIKKAMKDRSVSTSDMATHCEVTRGAVSNWFATGRVSKENLVKIAQRLNVPVEDLISGAAADKGAPAVQAPPSPLTTESSLADDTMTLLQLFNQLGNKHRASVIRFAQDQTKSASPSAANDVSLGSKSARSKPRAFKDEGATSARKKTSGSSAADRRRGQK